MTRLRTAAVALVALAATVTLMPVATASSLPGASPTMPVPTTPAPSALTSASTGGNAIGMSPNSTELVAAVNRTNEKIAFDFFVAKGLSKKEAAGIVGNLDQESLMDPNAAQSGGAGRGIAQWSVGGRWDTYSGDNEVHYTNVTLGVSRWNLNGQLKFIWYELSNFSYYGLSQLKATSTIDGAVVAFQDHFEGCGTCNTTARKAYAHDAYNRYA